MKIDIIISYLNNQNVVSHHDKVSSRFNVSLELESPDLVAQKFRSGEYLVSIYGLGHIGAPLASVWLRAGATVIGVDKSPNVIENAKKGLTHIPEPSVDESFSQGIKNNKFKVYEDPIQASVDSKLKMICVPVLIKNKKADLSMVKEVAKTIGKGLKKFDIISLHPSVPPSTTEKVLIPQLEKSSSLKAKQDFFVIYNPERIYEGRAIFDIESGHPGIVSGINEYGLELADKIFSLIYGKGVIKIPEIKTAEAEKLFEGVYRDVNIALANELARMSEKLGINFWEAQKAANSQNFCHIHDPGIGVGGACIPVYPQFILEVAEKNKINCKITKNSRIVNDSMPSYSLKNALKLIRSKDIKKSKVTILGLAFRGGVSDTRLSPTFEIIKGLINLKVKDILIHDPLVTNDGGLAKYKNIKLVNDLNYAISDRDLIILATNHKEYLKINNTMTGKTPIYDGRGILDSNNFGKELYRCLGIPTSP